jgi:carbonic anhydrase/acetyltransferase-like protein (isoleucine patch superfamily)
MTLLGRIISFYSTCILSLCAGAVLWFGRRPSLVQPVILAVILYIIPPLTFRLHRIFFPIRKSLSNLSERKYSPWWGAHQIQLIYTAIPQLEAALRLVPGLYSAWLRLWGSRIGRSVYWTPNVEITDRHELDIGDRVVCGHKCKFLGHAIKPRGPRGQELALYTRTIKIGSDVFIGAGSRIGPGAVIADGTFLPVLTDVHINQVVGSTTCSEQPVTF